MPNETNDRDQLIRLLHEVPIAMLTTVEDSGELRSRPMQIQKADFNGTLRFLTYRDSGKTEEIAHEPQTNVAVSCPEKGVFVSLTGTSKVTRDQAQVDELWQDEYKVWFPKGKDDPNIGVLTFKAHSGEYWDTPQDQPKQGYGANKQAKEKSEHGTVELA